MGDAQNKPAHTLTILTPWENSDPTINRVVDILISHGKITLVSRDRLWVLLKLVKQCIQLDGEVWEAGVYQGGTALLLKEAILQSGFQNQKILRLFDTFEGMPKTRQDIDLHSPGDFKDTSLEEVKKLVGTESFISYHKGLIPNTFSGLENKKICFLHADVDLYNSVKDVCEFCYPRVVPGGVIVFDDYGFSSTPGARLAVDEYFANKPEIPLLIPTGQAIVFRLPIR